MKINSSRKKIQFELAALDIHIKLFDVYKIKERIFSYVNMKLKQDILNLCPDFSIEQYLLHKEDINNLTLKYFYDLSQNRINLSLINKECLLNLINEFTNSEFTPTKKQKSIFAQIYISYFIKKKLFANRYSQICLSDFLNTVYLQAKYSDNYLSLFKLKKTSDVCFVVANFQKFFDVVTLSDIMEEYALFEKSFIEFLNINSKFIMYKYTIGFILNICIKNKNYFNELLFEELIHPKTSIDSEEYKQIFIAFLKKSLNLYLFQIKYSILEEYEVLHEK